MRFASPPVTGRVYRSPSSSNTMVCPSGDTSSEIQVPSDVVKSTLRVVFKGSESSRWAARDRGGRTAATREAASSRCITGTPGGEKRRQSWRPLTQASSKPVACHPWVVDKRRTPCDHSRRAITNQRLFRGPGLPPRSFAVSGALMGDPDGSDRRRRRPTGIRLEEIPPSDHQSRTVSGHEAEALL